LTTSILAVLALLLVLPYAFPPVYRFPVEKPFSGTSLYNPYALAHGPWRRANLHAHGRAWLGLTNGRQSDAEVVAAYRERGYDLAGVSNYQKLGTPVDQALSIYEHGFNLGKHHQLVIGARRVDWFDLPVWQGIHQKQYVIDRLGRSADIVGIAHPSTLRGYSYPPADLRRLTGYRLLEILNGPFTAESEWDAVLSAGHPVWAIGNDDTHDLTVDGRFGTAWNMIRSSSLDAAAFTHALAVGSHYAVLRTSDLDEPELMLSSVDVWGDVITVRWTGPPAHVSFIGQNGTLRKAVEAEDSASYTVAAEDTYIRAVLKASHRTLYLNPVIRFDGVTLAAPTATVDEVRTWAMRATVLAGCALVLSAVSRSRARQQRAGRRGRFFLKRGTTIFVVAGTLFSVPARAQNLRTTAGDALVDRPDLALTIEADFAAELPAGDSVFSLMETTQAEVISDRVSGGGLDFAAAPRLSAFGSSWTQTRFRLGDVDITDPSTGGQPLFLPELSIWQRISIATGVAPSDTSTTPGMVVTLEPRRPGDRWSVGGVGSTSFGDVWTAEQTGSVPPVARPTGWNRGSVLVSGPIAAGRAGLVAAGTWTGTSQTHRDSSASRDSSLGSAFGHLVVSQSDANEVRAFVAVQRALFAPADTAMFVDPSTRVRDAAVHVQTTWSHSDRVGQAWRVFGAFTRRQREPQSLLQSFVTIDRLSGGPVHQRVLDARQRTDRLISGGARTEHRIGPGELQAGVSVDNARSSGDPGFAGTIGELIDGLQSRLWRYSTSGLLSGRGSTTVSAFVADRLPFASRGTLDVGLRYERLDAGADGAQQNVGWSSWLPTVSARWELSSQHRISLFAGAARSAHLLPLDFLALGDPAASAIEVLRWTSTPSALMTSTVSRIDQAIERPYSNEFTFGVDARPRPGLHMQFAGFTKWERRLLGVVNEATNGPQYSTVGIPDSGPDVVGSADDQVLEVANLLPSEVPYQIDGLLTNLPDGTSRRLGIRAAAEIRSRRVSLLFTGIAHLAESFAANRNFGSVENDPGVAGDVAVDPNSAIHPRGRLFGDRAYMVKIASVYRLPWETTLGVIARYQDGQPFSRLVLVSDLNQGPDVVRAFPNGASRFTFTGTLDLRVQKTLHARAAVFLDAYNVLNLSEEVEERVVSGAVYRTPTAAQPPRTVHVGASVSF